MKLVALDDLNCPMSALGNGLSDARSLIAAIGKDALDERIKAAGTLIEDEARAVAVLDVCGMHDDIQEKAERIDENVPFAARDLLACIIALRVERRAPF